MKSISLLLHYFLSFPFFNSFRPQSLVFAFRLPPKIVAKSPFFPFPSPRSRGTMNVPAPPGDRESLITEHATCGTATLPERPWGLHGINLHYTGYRNVESYPHTRPVPSRNGTNPSLFLGGWTDGRQNTGVYSRRGQCHRVPSPPHILPTHGICGRMQSRAIFEQCIVGFTTHHLNSGCGLPEKSTGRWGCANLRGTRSPASIHQHAYWSNASGTPVDRAAPVDYEVQAMVARTPRMQFRSHAAAQFRSFDRADDAAKQFYTVAVPQPTSCGATLPQNRAIPQPISGCGDDHPTERLGDAAGEPHSACGCTAEP